MIRIFALLALLVVTLPASAGAEDMFERERDIISSTPTIGETQDCSRFSDCGKDAIGDTQELGNRFDNQGRGSTRSLSDNVLDQLQPASGR